MNKCSLLLVVCFVVLQGFNSKALAYNEIDIYDANDLISSNDAVVVIDVREKSEYCDDNGDGYGHVPGAYNYPWNSKVLRASYGDFSVDDVIIVICRSGSRGRSAASFLDEKYFQDDKDSLVYNVKGGTLAWKDVFPTAFCIDTDEDGINDDLDNCPSVSNPLQTDSDNDKIGNACDNDCPYYAGLSLVNLADLVIIASNWHVSGPDIPGDLNADGIVDIKDIAVFANYWLSSCDEND